MNRGVLALFAVLALGGCARGGSPTPRGDCASEGAPIVDATLLAWLSKARALHHEADSAEAESAPAKAIAALERVSSGRVPPAPEAEEVLADTRARLAELRAGVGDFSRAIDDVNDGLAHAKQATYFRGHLYEVMGLVEEKHAAALEKKGDAASARDARKRAIEASEQAVKIQDEVISQALGKERR